MSKLDELIALNGVKQTITDAERISILEAQLARLLNQQTNTKKET